MTSVSDKLSWRGDIVTRVIYVSRSLIAKPERAEACMSILRVSREKNAKVGITGGLFFDGRRFGQVLEGPAAAIDHLLEVIRGDTRHTEMAVTDRDDAVTRVFGDWSMALVSSLDVPAVVVSLPEEPVKNENSWLVTPDQFDVITRIKQVLGER